MKSAVCLVILVYALCISRVSAAPEQYYHASSPEHRVAMLELYTSEGCSSCPPADKWLSGLKQAGLADNIVVPLAFHVTYWDYIGWRDHFADSRYDDRQRATSRYNSSRSIYTPQFVLNGADYRSHGRISSDLDKINAQQATVNIDVSAVLKTSRLAEVTLVTDLVHSPVKEVALYLAVYENNLVSTVVEGENQGEILKHDFVVRKLYGPFMQHQLHDQHSVMQQVEFGDDWKRTDISLAVFAQHPHTGEILQAVSLKLN